MIAILEKPLLREHLWPRGAAMVHCLATAAFSSHVTFAKEGHEGSLSVALGVANILILEGVVLEGSRSFQSSPLCNEFWACDDIFRGTRTYALLCHALLIAMRSSWRQHPKAQNPSISPPKRSATARPLRSISMPGLWTRETLVWTLWTVSQTKKGPNLKESWKFCQPKICSRWSRNGKSKVRKSVRRKSTNLTFGER